jgi:hypothetical protein
MTAVKYHRGRFAEARSCSRSATTGSRMYGGTGNDRLVGGPGNDELFGGLA